MCGEAVKDTIEKTYIVIYCANTWNNIRDYRKYYDAYEKIFFGLLCFACFGGV